MDHLRTICFIHEVEDSYNACYLKQYFKWIGLSYLSYIPDSFGVGIDFLRKPENQKFDLVVSLNQAAQKRWNSIADDYGSRFIALDYGSQEPDESVLDLLMGRLHDTILAGHAKDCVLDLLLEIYKKHKIAALLYEYTYVLLDRDKERLLTPVLSKYEEIIKDLETLEKNLPPVETNDRLPLMEYFLFAKYNCQRRFNELCRMRNWMPPYPTKALYGNIDSIYQYDPGYYRTEYLKAKATEQDLMYFAYAKADYYKCLEKSTIEACKSYLYYQLGKWLDMNRQMYEAERFYQKSYKCNPTNVKPIFKIAVDAKRKKDRVSEKKYLRLIIGNWELFQNQKQNLPLMELEYAYKAYMLMDMLEHGNQRGQDFYSATQEILNFVKKMGAEEGGASGNSFINRLYAHTGIEPPVIRRAMAVRMDIKCKDIDDCAW